MDNLWALAVVAAVVVVVISFGLLAQANLREARATGLVTQLVQAVTTTYQHTRNYGNNANLIPTLSSFQRLPEDFVIRTTTGSGPSATTTVTVEHPFGGAVTIIGGPAGNTNRFEIAFDDLDDSVCAALAEKSAGKSRGRSGLVEVQINNSALALPYTVDQVAGECDDGNAANEVAWIYF